MLTAALIIFSVSSALVGGAAWGVWGRLPDKLEGFIVALAGGALMISAVLELIEPGTKTAGLLPILVTALSGAAVFSVCAWLIKQRFGSKSGGGLLAAVTLDGVPENLALGVFLISAQPLQAAALAGSIFLSNLPEAAGGARDMRKSGIPRARVLLIWTITAALLSMAALAGYLFLDQAGVRVLALISAFAGGAVVASLATEVFPKAFAEDRYTAGIATMLGFCAALWLRSLGEA